MSKHRQHDPAQKSEPAATTSAGSRPGAAWNGIRRLWLDADLVPLDPQPAQPGLVPPALRVDC